METQLPKTFGKLQMPPINPKTRVSAAEIALLLVIITLFYWFVISPKNAELDSLNVKLAGLQADQSKIESQKNELQRMISSMKNDPDDIAKLDEALPAEGKITVTNLLVEKFAADAGVVLDNASFTADGDALAAGNRDFLAHPYTGKRSLKKMTGNVVIKGQMSQIQNFLQKLENSGRIFDVSSFQISPDKDDVMVLSLGINTYYFAP